MFLAVLLCFLVLPGNAVAAPTPGQLEAWGSPGTTDGKLSNPAMLGVDSSDGSVFTGDVPSTANYRVQKFSSTGSFEGSVLIPRLVESTKLKSVLGIAVDPSLDRFYVLEGCRVSKPAGTCKLASLTFGARRILVFSTEPNASHELVQAAEPITLPSGSEALYSPQALAVDPSNHDLVVLAENEAGHTIVQRVGTNGTVGARFTDGADKLRVPGREATSLAVAPDGVAYTVTGGPAAKGSEATRAWRLPADLSALEEVPGFAKAAEDEAWAYGLSNPKSSGVIGGPQIAISPDGETLYWKESIEPSSPTEAGNILVRGYSLSEGRTSVNYGGTGAGECSIGTSEAGLATVGEKLVVFDYGPEGSAGATPPYGGKVITFGPGGSGCPVPLTKLKIDGSAAAEVTVERGDTVSFDASESQFFNGVPQKVVWEFGDGSKEEALGTPEEGGSPAVPAKLTTSHVYAAAGTYTVRVSASLENSLYGNPAAVERTVKVLAGEEFPLSVAKAGTGSGEVTSTPSGIACGGKCSALFEEGTEVELTAVAAPGSQFEGWSGACGGTGVCTVTMNAAKAVTATFAPIPPGQFPLTVTKAGTGSGEVTSVPSGIACGTECAQSFEEGTEVELTAVAAPGSQFEGWSGACGGTGVCTVTMNAAKAVTATFAPIPPAQFPLTIGKEGGGSGDVTSSPAGIACGAECSYSFDEGTEVELTAVAALGSQFEGWSGACTGTGACTVTMSAAREVTAEFRSTLAAMLVLSVEKAGTGTGTVTSSPTGISCGPVCAARFEAGRKVKLAVRAVPDSEFKRWEGACSGSGFCEVRMDEAAAVTAVFDSTSSGGGGGEGGAGGSSSGPPPAETKPPQGAPKPKTPRLKALARCKKLKGKARARCVKKVKSAARHKHGKRGRRPRVGL